MGPSGHSWAAARDDSAGCSVNAEEVDMVEEMIKKTGCLEHHYAVAECMGEWQDWRKCQPQLKEFRECMSAYQRSAPPQTGPGDRVS